MYDLFKGPAIERSEPLFNYKTSLTRFRDPVEAAGTVVAVVVHYAGFRVVF